MIRENKSCEQLNLFDSVETPDEKVNFDIYHYDGNWKIKTRTVNGNKGIVVYENKLLSKQHLKGICRNAVKIKRQNYGFNVYFVEKEENRKIFVRFINFTTKVKIDVFEHIDLYFDEEVHF